VRVLPGPHVDHFRPGELERFCSMAWRISAQADRMGYRLLGPRLSHAASASISSLGLPLGTIQVPGDGLPIVLLADHQPTGGYTVLACVIRADLHLLAQRAPGDEVRFALTTPEAARKALRARHAALQPVDPSGSIWPCLRWAS
jgi:allophanate hydrolase subunit 2